MNFLGIPYGNAANGIQNPPHGWASLHVSSEEPRRQCPGRRHSVIVRHARLHIIFSPPSLRRWWLACGGPASLPYDPP